jgi:hypothetical protein
MCRSKKWVIKMAEPYPLTPPPNYSASVPAALGIPARDLRGAVRELPKAGTVYQGAA